MTVAALALGVVTAILIVGYLLQQTRQREAAGTASVPVVVAKSDITPGATIKTEMVERKLVTPDTAAKTAVAQTKDAVGQRARYSIPAGAQVLPSMLVPADSSSALSYAIPEGKRAVAVTAGSAATGGSAVDLIRPGDYVDVLAVLDSWKLVGGEAQTNERPQGVVTVLQNVEVLAVANEAAKPGATGPEAAIAKNQPTGSSKNNTVTLAVDPSEAQLLFWAETQGKLRLSLRPFGEQATQTVAPLLEPLTSKP
jgi:pilus assembly protein CpaB